MSFSLDPTLWASRSVLNVSNGGQWNPKLALIVNSLWIKIKAQIFASQVLSKHTKYEEKREVIFFVIVALWNKYIFQD